MGPANGKKCSACGMFNHFVGSEVCKKKRSLRSVDEDYGDEINDPNLDFLYLDALESISEEDETSEDDFPEEETSEDVLADSSEQEDEYHSCVEEIVETQPAPVKKKKKRRKRQKKCKPQQS